MSSQNSPSKDDDSSMYNSALENLTFTSQNDGSGKFSYSFCIKYYAENILLISETYMYISKSTYYPCIIYNLIKIFRYTYIFCKFM